MRLLLSIIIFSKIILLTQAPTFAFDSTTEIKDEVVVDQVISPFLNTLRLDIQLPHGYTLLKKAEPNLVLFANDEQIMDRYYIDTLNEVIYIDKPIKASELFVYLSLYYCKEDEVEGLCIIKRILFEVEVDMKSQERELILEYKITDEEI